MTSGPPSCSRFGRSVRGRGGPVDREFSLFLGARHPAALQSPASGAAIGGQSGLRRKCDILQRIWINELTRMAELTAASWPMGRYFAMSAALPTLRQMKRLEGGRALVRLLRH